MVSSNTIYNVAQCSGLGALAGKVCSDLQHGGSLASVLTFINFGQKYFIILTTKNLNIQRYSDQHQQGLDFVRMLMGLKNLHSSRPKQYICEMTGQKYNPWLLHRAKLTGPPQQYDLILLFFSLLGQTPGDHPPQHVNSSKPLTNVFLLQ